MTGRVGRPRLRDRTARSLREPNLPGDCHHVVHSIVSRESIVRIVPPRLRWPLRRVVRSLRYLPSDLADTALGRCEPMVPPRRKMFMGGREYEAVGKALLRQFVAYGGLTERCDVLDVGCGIGRAAVPLTGFLSAEAAYHGFDVVADGVDWCTKQVSARFPNFVFEHADVYNGVYNPDGVHRAEEYSFPHDSATFDFAFATSVFTHMLAPEVDHYLAEIERVLRPGGCVFATFFLLNPRSVEAVASGLSAIDFCPLDDISMSTSVSAPEQAVAYQESFVRGSGDDPSHDTVDLPQLFHQSPLRVEPPRGIDDQHVSSPRNRRGCRVECDGCRVPSRPSPHESTPQSLRPDPELLLCPAPKRVGGREHDRLALLDREVDQLGGRRGLPGSVDTQQEDYVRSGCRIRSHRRLRGARPVRLVEHEANPGGEKSLQVGLRLHLAPLRGSFELLDQLHRDIHTKIGFEEYLLESLDRLLIDPLHQRGDVRQRDIDNLLPQGARRSPFRSA